MQSSQSAEQRASVLIVDDERGPAESLRMIFKPTYNVFVANGGAQALDILRSAPIDVVTLDLRMPSMSGVEVMQHIKAQDPDIEVIIVTGYSSVDTAIAAVRHCAFDYISKPFEVAEIRDLVGRAVHRRRETLRNRRVKEDFLANVSHELRTPLNAILGYSAILGEELRGSLRPELRTALERLQTSSYDLFEMVESVLLLNEIDAGDLDVEVGELDLAATLVTTIRKFQPAAAEKGIRLSLELAEPQIPMQGDRDKIERVIRALLDNAVKFTDSGQVTVTTRRDRAANRVHIEIRDSGIGMTPPDIEAALRGLSQVDTSSRRRFSGLGLGLRLGSRLIRLLGGELRIDSARGSGTMVTASLPLRSDNPGNAPVH